MLLVTFVFSTWVIEFYHIYAPIGLFLKKNCLVNSAYIDL